MTLYVGTYGGTLYALNTADGKTLWSKPASSWIWAGPVSDGTNLYVGDANGKLVAYPALRWQQALGTGFEWSHRWLSLSLRW